MDDQTMNPGSGGATAGSGPTGNGGTPQSNQPFSTNVKLPAHPATNFNEVAFVQLLAGSISLTIDEKKKIIEAVPKLSQYQIDELIKIFEEEKRKFAELAEKHAEQINKLKAQHASEWQMFEMEIQQSQQKGEDQSKADEIRKKLGL